MLNLTACCLVLLSSANVQTTRGLEVTLALDKASYKPGDTPEITVLVTNHSRKDIYVFQPMEWGERSSVSIWLKDSSGRDLGLGFIPDERDPPPSSKDAFLRLPPEHVFGHTFRITFASLGARGPGSYEVHAYYHSPISREFAFGLPAWTREMGILSSNKVWFTLAGQ